MLIKKMSYLSLKKKIFLLVLMIFFLIYLNSRCKMRRQTALVLVIANVGDIILKVQRSRVLLGSKIKGILITELCYFCCPLFQQMKRFNSSWIGKWKGALEYEVIQSCEINACQIWINCFINTYNCNIVSSLFLKFYILISVCFKDKAQSQFLVVPQVIDILIFLKLSILISFCFKDKA